MPLKDRLLDDIKAAMRAKDKSRLATLRLINADIKQREVDEQTTLDDLAVIAVLERMVKQRRESISQYRAAERLDLADREQQEVDIIRSYLPEPLAEAELDAAIAGAVAETGAQSVKDMGKVMALLKGRLQGRADMAVVSARVKERLGAP
ncbi:MAG: GatB/YqeY domain-containing protein [Candidatus Competibacterales bacterium]